MSGPEPHDAHAALHGHAQADAVARSLDALRTMGERITAPRRAVIGLLATSHEHQPADRVAAALAELDPPVHRATVYRTLNRLAELGIVSRMSAGDAARYHLAVTPAGHEHLHARCRRCGRVVVLPVNALQGAADRLARYGVFRLEPAQSDLVGLCEACAAA